PDTKEKESDTKPGTNPAPQLHHGTIFDENDPRESEVHPELQRLPALSLRGTFEKAYGLLIKIVGRIGWDDLLKHRSKVFVMEEEYRIQRALVDEGSKADNGSNENGVESHQESLLGDVEIRHPPAVETKSNDKGKANLIQLDTSDDTSAASKPTGLSDEEADFLMGSPKKGTDPISTNGFESVALDGDDKPAVSPSDKVGLTIDDLLKKTSAEVQRNSLDEKKDGGNDTSLPTARIPNPRPKRTGVALTFRHKRLCEKWLDNLFMVLYNDLRLYTALKQEMSQYRSSDNTGPYKQLLFRKTGAEWEIYGDLSLRLGHPDDAAIAYRLSLEQRFSVKSWLRLLSMAAEGAGNISSGSGSNQVSSGSAETALIREALAASIRLVTSLDRAYIENTYPSPISRAIFALVRKYGYQKVHNVLISMNASQKSYRLITRYFEYAETFRISGVDW
ncbi:hypothetical protein HK405_010649, partial [Cladochytrium tenue]